MTKKVKMVKIKSRMIFDEKLRPKLINIVVNIKGIQWYKWSRVKI